MKRGQKPNPCSNFLKKGVKNSVLDPLKSREQNCEQQEPTPYLNFCREKWDLFTEKGDTQGNLNANVIGLMNATKNWDKRQERKEASGKAINYKLCKFFIKDKTLPGVLFCCYETL